MKKYLFTIVAALCAMSATAQKSDTLKGAAADTLIFTAVENMPQFPGGKEKFYRFLSRTIRYPAIAREKNIQGKVILTMVVEKDGSLTHLRVIKSLSDDTDEEALRVMRLCPKWNPGTQNGAAVRVQYAMPISFTLAN